MKFFLSLVILLFAGSEVAHAANFGREMPSCQITPASTRESYPGEKKIITSASLAQPAGKSIPAPGQPLVVYGRVYDANCVPLMGARVDVWQADTKGKYVYPGKDEFANPYPIFAGSGQAYTDNEGRFTFFTIYPGAQKQKISGKEFENAPHINIRITDKRLRSPFTTVMYFANDRRNETDPSYKRVAEVSRPLLAADVRPINPQFPGLGLNAYFDITLQVKDKFRKY